MADESKASAAGNVADPTDLGAVDVNEYFKTFPLSEFEPPPGGQVVVIPSDATIAEAVNTLAKHNILAAPVRDVTCIHPDPAWHELYLGLFSMTDAVFAALKMDEIVSKDHMPVVEEGKASEDSFLKHFTSQSYFRTTPVTEALHTFKYGPFVPLQEEDGTSLLDAALILGKYAQHRVVVVQPSTGGAAQETMADIVATDRRLKNILTQSALVKLISRPAIATKLRAITSKTLHELGLATSKDVVKVGVDDTALDAFKAIANNNVSAVAVVDEGGKLLACVSNRDARVLATARHTLRMLHGSVRSLLQLSHESDDNIAHPSIHAKPTDTLETVIQRLATSRIHRIFVVNEASQPVSVVSLTDVLSALVKEPSRDYFKGYFDSTVAASGDTLAMAS